MTRRDLTFKWFIYALALALVWIVEALVLSRVPFPGAHPILLPLAAVVVAVLEGPSAGAGFGLAVGILADAVYGGIPGGMTIGLPLVGALSGALAQYVISQNYFGVLICSTGTLMLIALARMVAWLLAGVATLPAMLAVAVPEFLWSLLFTLPVYGLFKLVYHRVGGNRLM